MAIKATINSVDFKSEFQVEIDGVIYDIPERTGEFDNKIAELEKRRTTMREYDFLKEIITAIFGKSNAQKIIKDGINTNLDYLSKIYMVTLELIYKNKEESERKIVENKLNTINPLLENIAKAAPLAAKIK